MTRRLVPLPVDVHTHLHRLVAAGDTAERGELLDEFARILDPAYRSVAAQLCSQYRIDAAAHGDDILQLVHERSLLLIRDLLDHPDEIATIRSWVGYVKVRCRNAVQQFVDTPAGTAAMSGMSSKHRRVRRAEKTRADLTARLGRDPTSEEILAAANAPLRDRPSQSNMLLTHDDLSWETARTTPLDAERDATPSPDPEPAAHLFVLTHGESRAFVREALNVLRDTAGDRIARIADTWLAPAMTPGGVPLSVLATAEACSIDEATVEDVVLQMRGAATRVLTRRVTHDPSLRAGLEAYARDHGYDHVL